MKLLDLPPLKTDPFYPEKDLRSQESRIDKERKEFVGKSDDLIRKKEVKQRTEKSFDAEHFRNRSVLYQETKINVFERCRWPNLRNRV